MFYLCSHGGGRRWYLVWDSEIPCTFPERAGVTAVVHTYISREDAGTPRAWP